MLNVFGKYIKDLREDRQLSLRQVESETGISNSYLSQIERGDRDIPNSKILVKLVDLYGITFQSLAEVAGMQAALAKRSSRKKELSINIPSPDEKYITKEYKKLSEVNKGHLKAFLQYLVQNSG